MKSRTTSPRSGFLLALASFIIPSPALVHAGTNLTPASALAYNGNAGW